MPYSSDDLIRLVQDDHTGEVIDLENQIAARALAGSDRAFEELIRRTLAAWTAAFGGPDRAALAGDALRRIIAAARTAVTRLLNLLADRAPSALAERLAPAVAMGVTQGTAFVRAASGRRRREPRVPAVSRVLRAEASRVREMVTDRRDRALFLLHPDRVSRWSHMLAGLGAARAVLPAVRGHIAWVINTAVHEGLDAVVRATAPQRVWVSEVDACFIPSTRVLAPSVLSQVQPTPSVLVTAHKLQRLPSDPAVSSVALGSDAGALAATAMAIPLRDRFGQVKAVTSRYYVGQVVTIRTAGGEELTGTPNHPIATGRGWVALAELKVGDHVFSRGRSERSVAGVHPDDDDVPPTIEQVAEAFPFAARVVPTSPEDFHGDGAGSDVHVVRTDGLLLQDGESALAQHVGKESLHGRDVELKTLARLGLADLCFDAAGPALEGCGSLGADLPATFRAQLTRSAKVSAERQSVSLEPPTDGVHVDAVEYGDFLGRLAGIVEPDQVVEVRHGEFSGHVYNLETREGWYLSENIVCHNCVSCLAYTGRTASVGGQFPGGLSWDPRQRRLGVDGIDGPPLHASCRCRAVPWDDAWTTTGVPFSLALHREAERSIGFGARRPSESGAARVRAARELLRTVDDLLPAVEARARTAVRTGRFAAVEEIAWP